MQYQRPARLGCLLLLVGCGSSAMTAPDAAAPDAGEHPAVWPWATADAATPPAPDAAGPLPAASDALPASTDALPTSACLSPETAPLRRLTTTQYQRTVRQLT